jgi:hypothetical protein
MLVRFIASSLQLALASLIIGAWLSAMRFSTAGILGYFGLTPAQAAELVMKAVEWSLPNMVLGSFVVIPLWLLINVVRIPRRSD